MTRIALFIAVGLGLSACGGDNGPVSSNFFREAGAQADGGDFGNAAMNNVMFHTGERSYAENLNGRFATSVPTTVNFAFNSAELDQAGMRILDQQADFMRQFPEVRFRVYGHTDAVGSTGYNKRLGKQRARAVVSYLASRGVSKSRLEALTSFGEARPLVVTEEPETRNRRTVTEVSGFVRSNPSVMDGKYAQIVYRDYVLSGEVATTLTGTVTGGGED